MALFRARPHQGNIAFYLRKALPVAEPWPSQIAYDYLSDQPALLPEEIFITTNSLPTPLSEGMWYLGIFNPKTNAVTYDLSVIESSDSVPAFINLAANIPLTNTISLPGLVDYYLFNVSSNASEVRFETLNADGNVDLYVKRNLPLPAPGVADYSSTNLGSASERISINRGSTPVALSPGFWFIGVSNASATNVTYTLKASEVTAVNPITEVHIYPRPVITNGNFVITWDSVVGAIYRIEGKARLTDTSWNVIEANYIASGLVSTYSIPLSNTNRFFRVIGLSGGSTPVGPQTPAVINSKPIYTNGSLTITWSSAIGASYQVEGKVKANDTAWNTVSPVIIAAATNTSYNVPIGNTNRFFRVITLSGGNTNPVGPSVPAAINSKPVYTNGSLTITWSSTVGASYQVEGKVKANDTAWNTVSPVIIAAATNTSYSVPIGNTNRFFRVITLSGGSSSVTSQSPPIFNSFTRSSLTNGVSLAWQGVTGQKFEIQYSTNMVTWTSLGNNISSSSGVFTFTDTSVTSSTLGAKRFYRLLLMP